MKGRKDVSHTLESLFRTAGVPKCLRPDGGKEIVDGEFRKVARRYGTPIFPNEPFAKNANIASGIGAKELKREYRRDMIATGSPECLWDLGLTYRALVRCHTAQNVRGLGKEIPQAILTGDTPDISPICEFGWYEWCWYHDVEDEGLEVKKLGRYLGPSFDVGDALCAKLLTEKGSLLNRTSYFRLSDEDNNSEVIKKRKEAWDETLKKNLIKKGKEWHPMEPSEDETPQDFKRKQTYGMNFMRCLTWM